MATECSRRRWIKATDCSRAWAWFYDQELEQANRLVTVVLSLRLDVVVLFQNWIQAKDCWWRRCLSACARCSSNCFANSRVRRSSLRALRNANFEAEIRRRIELQLVVWLQLVKLFAQKVHHTQADPALLT